MDPQLTIATWNARSLTEERFTYCRELGYDILAITELWRTAEKFTNGTREWTHSKAKLKEDGSAQFPKDKAAGVGILLSKRAEQKVRKRSRK